MGSIEDAGAVVLETDGSLTVVKDLKSLENETMKKVNRSAEITE